MNILVVICCLVNNHRWYEALVIISGEDQSSTPEGVSLSCLGFPIEFPRKELVGIYHSKPWSIWIEANLITIPNLGRTRLDLFEVFGYCFRVKRHYFCWIEILDVIGDYNDIFFEFSLAQRFRISSVASSFSCSLIYLYIWAILWKISHSSLGSLCLALLLLMLDTFNNPVLLFFFCVSWPSSIQATRFITGRV